jgi:16S rRNA (adenine1518-N6/adenine1519-N6)-dimethyltransferase
VIEIGPGRGALTERLIDRVSHLTAIEIDSQLVPLLRARFGAAAHFELIHQDALDVDFASYRPDVVSGNLPYYVATPLIERTVRSGFPGVFLIQKEVALRLAAVPGSRDYGYLSVSTQLFAEPRVEFTVPPGAFRPAPKVDSAVVSVRPADRASELEIGDADTFLRFLSACFRQKRKTLRNNLRAEYPGIQGQAEASLRAEQVSLRDLAGLYRRIGGGPAGAP